jgi:pilus assembly protein CpaE
MIDMAPIEAKPAAESGLKILVFGPMRDGLDAIARVLRSDRSAASVTAVVGAVEELASAVAREDPDLLIAQLPDAGATALQQIDRLDHLYSRMTPVLLCRDQSAEFLMEAMRAGVREVMPVDVAPELLVEAIARFSQRRAAVPQQHGKVLAFISCKGGGGGATFLATNVAYALADAEHRRVIVIDLNLQWGDAAFLVSEKKPAMTLADVATQIHRVDAAFLASCLVNAHASLGILAAPEDPVHALDVKPEHIDVLLRIARNHYDFVVLDAGRALDAVTIRALDYADVIYPVMQLTLPFIRDGKRLLAAFHALGYSHEKVKLIVNRYEKNGDVRLGDMETATGAKTYFTFPNDYAVVSAAINQGVPVTKLAHGSAIAKSVREFAHALVPEPAAETAGWFSRMIGRS